ncbi:hypothetical protein FKP32DRAFT_497786 [Trametes sanguinea]|nr:hypothetical protein FKP32DRAFT_497786 [Trametes sanguinea]
MHSHPRLNSVSQLAHDPLRISSRLAAPNGARRGRLRARVADAPTRLLPLSSPLPSSSPFLPIHVSLSVYALSHLSPRDALSRTLDSLPLTSIPHPSASYPSACSPHASPCCPNRTFAVVHLVHIFFLPFHRTSSQLFYLPHSPTHRLYPPRRGFAHSHALALVASLLFRACIIGLSRKEGYGKEAREP